MTDDSIIIHQRQSNTGSPVFETRCVDIYIRWDTMLMLLIHNHMAPLLNRRAYAGRVEMYLAQDISKLICCRLHMEMRDMLTLCQGMGCYRKPFLPHLQTRLPIAVPLDQFLPDTHINGRLSSLAKTLRAGLSTPTPARTTKTGKDRDSTKGMS
jgi:hypothetical protein